MKSKKILCCMLAAALTAGGLSSVSVSAFSAENNTLLTISDIQLTADKTEFDWDRDNTEGITLQTNSQSKEIVLYENGKLLASSVINKNLMIENGEMTIGAELLKKLENGENTLTIIFKEGTLDITVNITGEIEPPEEVSIPEPDIDTSEPADDFEITADQMEFTWDRSNTEGIAIQTGSQSKEIALRKDGKLLASSLINKNLTIENGDITIGAELLKKLDNGENTLVLVLKEGALTITIDITGEENQEITAKKTEFTWNRKSPIGIAVYTNSQSKSVKILKDGEEIASDEDKGVSILLGRISITSKILNNLADGENKLTLVLDDASIDITVNITEEEIKEITAKKTEFTWDRSSPIGIAAYTNSKSKSVKILKDGEEFASNEDRGVYILLGRISIMSKILRNLDNGENKLTLVLDDALIDITVYVTDKNGSEPEKYDINAKTSDYTWDRSDPIGIAVYTNSKSSFVGLRKNGEILATSDDIKNMYITLGRVGITAQVLQMLEDGDNKVELIFDDGSIEININITDRNHSGAAEKEITADTVSFTWDRSDLIGITVHTNSESDTVTLRKDGGLLAVSDGKKLFITNGTVGITSEILRKLDDGNNNLKLVFKDGTLDIKVKVTDNQKSTSAGNDITNTNSTNANNTNKNTTENNSLNINDMSVPKTGSTAAVAAMVLAAVSAGAIAIVSAKKKKSVKK